MDFEHFCFKVCLAKLTTVVLSTCIGVGGCSCPRNFSVCRKGMASFALSKVAAISVSAAEDITFFKMVLMTCAAPLGFACSGLLLLSAKKKKPPTLLLAFDTERYELSLCMYSIMPLQ